MIRSLFRRPISSLHRIRTFQTKTYPDDFFRFSRGRFVCDEVREMTRRHVAFNMAKLCKAAASAIGCVIVTDVVKCADGMYNKAFLITMEDGKQVIAKVPNPNAGRPHYTTASEVATLDFVRNVLEIPSPRVLAWSSDTNNTVGAEYIIMEEARGVPLEKVWLSLDFTKRTQVVRSVARHLRTCTQISFSKIGSLYYTNDLINVDPQARLYVDQRSQDEVKSTQFAIGPTNGRDWVDSDRAALDCDRGPWDSILDYQRAIVRKETFAVKQASQLPKNLFMLCGPNLYQPTAAKKLKALETFAEILPFILPKEALLNRPLLWHDDLHAENIFVDPEDPTKILTIIDWQSANISPLYEHTIQPAFIEYNEPFSPEMERPTLTVEESMNSSEKAAAISRFEDRSLQFAFNLILKSHIEPAFRALQFKETSVAEILLVARRLYELGEAHCMSLMVALRDEWSNLPLVVASGNQSFPLHFSEKELAEFEQDLNMAIASQEAMSEIKEALGDLFPEKGIVRHDQYDEAKAALRRMKARVLEEFANDEQERREWEAHWPFDD